MIPAPSQTPTQAPTLSGVAAVTEGLPGHPAMAAILALGEHALLDARYDRDELTLTVAPEDIVPACSALKNAGYNFFEDMTAVDWFPSSPRFQLSYHLLSHTMMERIRLRVMVDDAANGALPAVASIVPLWPGANFYEREVFDLFGIRFEGHPDLRRIMMPDDWQGHPLRKDYPVEGYR
jgi:NADH-quinone oxidoreductase subunit C